MMPEEKILEKKVSFYEYILNNIDACIWINNAEGNIVWTNKKTTDTFGKMSNMCIPESEIISETISKSGLQNSADFSLYKDCYTTMFRRKDRNSKWLNILTTTNICVKNNLGKRFKSINCGIILTEKQAELKRFEFLLKENYCLKNQIKLKKLSNREEDILKSIVRGKSTKQIAIEKNISFHTVESHRKNIMKKLEFHNVADLVRFATECGLL